MHRDTKQTALPALTADLLRDRDGLVDNLFADLWRQVGMKTLLSRAGFHKRSGTPIRELSWLTTANPFHRDNDTHSLSRVHGLSSAF